MSYGLALDGSASRGDVVIEAAGFRFVAAKSSLPLVVGLRVGVMQRLGRKVLVGSHPKFNGGGC